MDTWYNKLYKRYFAQELPTEVKIYNGIHAIATIAMLFSTILVRIFFENKTRSFLIMVVMAIFSLYTLYIGNTTKRYEIHAIIFSCVLNLVFFPMIYFEYAKLSFCIPVYFIFGLMYNIFLLSNHFAVVFTAVDILCYIILLYAGEMRISLAKNLAGETILDYLAVLVGIVVTSVSCGLAIRIRARLNAVEEENLERLHTEALSAYVGMDIFLVNMSHEIRTPMNAIIGTVDLLLEQDVNDHVKECVYNILNSSNALLSLTDEVMDLSKTGSQEININNGRFDLAQLLMDIVNMASVRLMDSSVKLFVEIDETLPKYIYGDGPRLRQVFINILNNAVKYTEQGHIILRMYAGERSEEEIELKAEVEDTGIGIKAEDIPHLFELYKRIDLTDDGLNAVEGTGLGLAICKEIIDKMGGKISVKSSYHVGSNFSFSVQMQPDDKVPIVDIGDANLFSVLLYIDDEAECNALKKILRSLGVYSESVNDKRTFENFVMTNSYSHIFVTSQLYYGDMRFLERELTKESLVILSDLNELITVNKVGYIMTRPVHILNVASVLTRKDTAYAREVVSRGSFTCEDAAILVVDDNLTNLNVAGGILKKYGATVVTALSGRECLDLVRKRHIDLIFMDYMMPEMNGIDTLEAIRAMKDPEISQIPVVALTANVINGAREMFLDAGFNDFISKPIEIDRIEKTLKNLLPSMLLVYSNEQ
ncbi:MAG: response regulator [Lachnospiraceae bacterium]|nr:response regulator [Lachnospiraceae bacterium]